MSDLFLLLGHDCPLGEYPAPVVPVGELDGKFVAIYATTSGADVVEIAPTAHFTTHNSGTKEALKNFSFRTQRLFAFDANRVVGYTISEEREFFISILTDSLAGIDNPFLRLAFAKATLDADVLLRELIACGENLRASAPRLLPRWYEQERASAVEAGLDDRALPRDAAVLLGGPGFDQPKVSIVIPVYNEKSTIDEILRRVQGTKIRKEVIIVDDCSTDGTRPILENMAGRQASGETWAPAQDGGAPIDLRDLQFFFQVLNQGKGAALRRGFAQATGELLLVQDADLEYDPRDYPKLIEPIIDGRADVVYGSRFLGGPPRVESFWHYDTIRILTQFSNTFTKLKLSDIETCYKVFRSEVLKGIELKSNRFGFEPEVTAKIAKGNWRVYEVPITYAGRTYEEGKKFTWTDGVLTLWSIIRFSFPSRKRRIATPKLEANRG
jgi:glycosyltransferase involved in cell wall biosynthesis